MYKLLPDVDILRDTFDYNITTGRLHWRTASGASSVGKVAGGIDSKGYYRLRFKGVDYRCSRIIYKWLTGVDPNQLTIDHIDNITTNDYFWNLRLATQEEQIHNRRLNCTGVRKVNGRYQMRIMIRGKRTCQRFNTIEEAERAYEQARANHPDALTPKKFIR